VIGSRNFSRRNAPLAWRPIIEDLEAHLAPIDRYGLTGFGSAIADAIHGLIRASRNALGAIARSVGACDRDCEAA
jgi:hypothetical protein